MASKIALFLFFVLFIYFGSRKPSKIEKRMNYPCDVSIVIPCCNEELTVEKKLANLFETASSHNGTLRVYMVDDGSTDNTFEVAEDFKNSRGLKNLFLWKNAENAGKARVLNSVIQKVEGDVIVITDADALWEGDALLELVANFNDPTVGAANGRISVPKEGGKLIVKEEGLYRRLYNVWRCAESNLDSCTVFNGTLMAFRRELLERIKIEEDTYTDDIDLSFKIRKLGYRAIYEPKAFVREFISSSILSRMKQEIRRAGGLTQVFLNNLDMLGRYGLFGKVVYPISFYMHVLSPICSLMILFLFPFILLEFPFVLLAGFLLLIPTVRTAILGYFSRHLALVVGLLIPRKGKWKPIRK